MVRRVGGGGEKHLHKKNQSQHILYRGGQKAGSYTEKQWEQLPEFYAFDNFHGSFR